MTGQQFAAGDRVRIVGDHPWKGHSGTVNEPMAVAGATGWVVTLDDQAGLRAFAEARNLRGARGDG